MDLFDSIFEGKGLNILTWINGGATDTNRHKKYRILSAHYDGPDEVDNASGVLAVLIFASHLHKNLEEDKHLLFFPDREEVFQEGSKHLIENIELDKVKSFFNVEGIGRGGKVISMRNTPCSLTDYCNKEHQDYNKIFLTDASVFTKAGSASYDVFSVPGINPYIVTDRITTEHFI